MPVPCFFLFFLVFILEISGEETPSPEAPAAVYLTWQKSPETTMTVRWLAKKNESGDEVEYKNVKETSWKKAAGSRQAMPKESPFFVHTVELEKLAPDSEYEFRAAPFRKTFKFRTMPLALNREVKFVAGGDVYHDTLDLVSKMNQVAANENPDFALVGGDLAYANGKFHSASNSNARWIEWLANWTQTMVKKDGTLIPMIPAIGNHDVQRGGFNQTPKQGEIFYSLFATPTSLGYRLLDFGDYLSIIILDSGHTHPVDGDQAHWLYHALQDRARIPHKFALYHVGAYPSIRSYHGKRHQMIRRHWSPIFEQFGLSMAFEHHDHAYKRTFPIKQGRIDPEGVVYVGDGAWGVKKPRSQKRKKPLWYLAKTLPSQHVAIITIDNEKRLLKAVDANGEVIDQYVQPIRPAVSALEK